MVFRTFTSVVVLIFLQGCAFNPQLTNIAMDHDLFVADTTNKKTVRNILRARDRQGLTFTRFSQITGSFSTGGSAGLDASIAGVTSITGGSNDGQSTFEDNTFGPSIGVTVETGSNFNIVVDESDEFQRGISTQISEGTVLYFLSQGWPPELITHLLVDRIDVSAKIRIVPVDGPSGAEVPTKIFSLESYDNDPDSVLEAGHDGLLPFDEAIRCRTLSFQRGSSDGSSFSFESPSELAKLEAQVLGRISNFEPKDDADRTQDDEERARGFTPRYTYSVSAQPRYFLTISDQRPVVGGSNTHCDTTIQGVSQSLQAIVDDEDNDFFADLRNGQIIPQPRILPTTRTNTFVSDGVGSTGTAPDEAGSDGQSRLTGANYFNELLPSYVLGGQEYRIEGDLLMDFQFRSTDGVIYYLGEYLRAQDDPNQPMLEGDEAGDFRVPIIRIDRDEPRFEAEHLLTEVSYRGSTYYVPSTGAVVTEERGRTSQVIAFVNQLLNLHRSSEDLPTTPVVQVLN